MIIQYNFRITVVFYTSFHVGDNGIIVHISAFRFEKYDIRFNDLKRDQALLPGTVVYLSYKKNHTQAGLDKYIVEEDGEDFHAICQRFAVKEKSVLKMNGLKKAPVLREGDELKLR